MDIVVSIMKMLGGLVLLIYGMNILSTNLKKISGGKLEKILLLTVIRDILIMAMTTNVLMQ